MGAGFSAALPTILTVVVNLILCLFFEQCDNPVPAPPGGGGGGGGSTPSGAFTIELVNLGTNSNYDAEFRAAKLRWERVIVNDLPNVPTNQFSETVYQGLFAKYREAEIDDVVIGYQIGDLEGGILGRAGPRYVRDESGTTAVGIMQFSEDFFRRGTSADNLIVITHEMGHVLGLGLRWRNNRCDSSCQTNGRGTYAYTCSAGLRAYQSLGLRPPVGTGNTLQVANDGGSGSACKHWDSESFSGDDWSELMTPFFDPNKRQLLTVASIASLTDIGDYEVNLNAADPIPRDGNFQGEQFDGFPNRLSTSRYLDLTEEVIEEVETIVIDF